MRSNTEARALPRVFGVLAQIYLDKKAELLKSNRLFGQLAHVMFIDHTIRR